MNVDNSNSDVLEDITVNIKTTFSKEENIINYNNLKTCYIVKYLLLVAIKILKGNYNC